MGWRIDLDGTVAVVSETLSAGVDLTSALSSANDGLQAALAAVSGDSQVRNKLSPLASEFSPIGPSVTERILTVTQTTKDNLLRYIEADTEMANITNKFADPVPTPSPGPAPQAPPTPGQAPAPAPAPAPTPSPTPTAGR